MPKTKASKICAACPAQITSGSRCEKCRIKRNARLKVLRQEKIENGICHRCTQPAVPGLVACEKHRKDGSRPGYYQDWYKARRARGLCINCDKKAVPGHDRCKACRTKANEAMRHRNQRIRKEAILAYGDRCACCGEPEFGFLTIDHVNGGGSAHRRSIGVSSGTAFYRWLIRSGFPSGFQVLCMNCNAAKQWLGKCPHQTKRNRQSEST